MPLSPQGRAASARLERHPSRRQRMPACAIRSNAVVPVTPPWYARARPSAHTAERQIVGRSCAAGLDEAVLAPAFETEQNFTVFGLGPGEIMLLVLLGVIFLGPSKLPDLAQRLRSRVQGDLGLTPAPSWKPHEWLLVIGVLVLGILAIASVTARG